jgi:hypothetical protein
LDSDLPVGDSTTTLTLKLTYRHLAYEKNLRGVGLRIVEERKGWVKGKGR